MLLPFDGFVSLCDNGPHDLVGGLAYSFGGAIRRESIKPVPKGSLHFICSTVPLEEVNISELLIYKKKIARGGASSVH